MSGAAAVRQRTDRKRVICVRELTVDAKVENAGLVADFVNAELEAMDCPLKAQLQIDVAVDEIFSNIAYYAYRPGTGTVTIRVEKRLSPPAALLTFTDGGKPYDPLQAEDPDTTLGVEEREIGGLGIFLVKKTMDAVRYEYRDGRNVLQIEKRLEPPLALPE